jgi:hypothetical protein
MFRADARVEAAMTPPSPDHRSIRAAIADEESRLLRLETELTEAQARLAALKTALAAQRDSIEASASTPATAVEKLALFRSRFRGRADIYPRFWTNARTGRKGYAPESGIPSGRGPRHPRPSSGASRRRGLPVAHR